MKIVKVLGGLGNQMFQYAFYLALSKRHSTVKVDLSGYQAYSLHNGFELTRVFGIKPAKASLFTVKLYNPNFRSWIYRKCRRVCNLKDAYTIEQKPFIYDQELLAHQKPMLYWGYWQHQDYFLDIAPQIRAAFQFKKALNEANTSYLQHINESNSVSVHIRRGDYLKDDLLGGLCSINYYNNAIAHMRSVIEFPVFFIFSDDLEWCKHNLHTGTEQIYVSGNEGENSYLDMQLMSSCKHQIIANSSFSWWAAWLNTNPEKTIISPEKWTNHNEENQIIPKEWIKI